MTLVLDAEAFSRFARSVQGGGSAGRVLNALRAAVAGDEEVLVPAAVLAELYRGGAHDQVVDSCLSRFPAVTVVDTDRVLARHIGHLLARAGRGSEDHVDATVVAAAIVAGGAVIATGDAEDMRTLADGLVAVEIEPV